jgi:DNA-binding PadR family transcriptional regulator
MSPTRLLVLGVVRILQPVHGYDVRRELLSWQLDERVNVQPGSIYSALKTLEKDGLIAVTPSTPTEGRPARTEYQITAEGEKEFAVLLRAHWWRVQHPAEPLAPALCLMPFMPRAELVAALQSRAAQLEGQLSEMAFLRATIKDGDTGADGAIPEHVREIVDFFSSRSQAELEWTRRLVRKLRNGDYQFVDETAISPVAHNQS